MIKKSVLKKKLQQNLNFFLKSIQKVFFTAVIVIVLAILYYFGPIMCCVVFIFEFLNFFLCKLQSEHLRTPAYDIKIQIEVDQVQATWVRLM